MGPSIPVHLVPYDPRWPEIAARHSAALEAIPGVFSSVQHIGSTSVPGLIAKPVVDLIALSPKLDLIDTHRPEIEALGYVWHGEFGVDGRRFCTLDNPETRARVINLHCYQLGSPHPSLQLAFRDYLLAFPDAAARYAEEKRRAMALFPDNSTLYAAEKGTFIRATIERALSWSGDRSAP